MNWVCQHNKILLLGKWPGSQLSVLYLRPGSYCHVDVVQCFLPLSVVQTQDHLLAGKCTETTASMMGRKNEELS